ncbi:unnamed protein product [Nezara viridula]|uniref:Neuropeptide n=1 Tax=Nezara viridula TaxID=85310 RepID=A0A9P0H321_NEZVI|nr:unnamed protein product [Nezara viridula]
MKMKPLGLVLVASIISLSAGNNDGYDFGYNLAPISLLYLDKALYDFHAAEDAKSDPNSRTRKDEVVREPHPGYYPCPCSYDPKGAPENPVASNSEETSDAARTDPMGALINQILNQASTSQPSESTGNGVDGSPKNEVNSYEEYDDDMSKESSHEYHESIRWPRNSYFIPTAHFILNIPFMQ